MAETFAPKFKNFQADIEAYLAAAGKREKARDGFVVFRGYEHALNLVFDQYLTHRAFEPLVGHFRAWNWELSYDDHLLRLTDALIQERDWVLLKRLWGGVISKRRKLYNDARRIETHAPGSLPASTLRDSRNRLLETLERVRAYSHALGHKDDQTYSTMIERVKAGRQA